MRNVHTYRICALAAMACIPLGVARNEIWTVVVAGVGALLCLRWARLEREADERAEAWARQAVERAAAAAADRPLESPFLRVADAYREIGEALGGTLSHVRLVRDDEAPVGPAE